MLHNAANGHGTRIVGDGIDINFDGVFEKLIDQNRAIRVNQDCRFHITLQITIGIDDLHGATPEHIAGTDDHGVADSLGNS